MPTTLLLDAAGTLIRTAEPVGEVYARHFAAAGVAVSPAAVQDAFAATFAAAPPPEFDAFDNGHDAERARWKTLVAGVLGACGPDAAGFAGSDRFSSCFDGLYVHYADPAAWTVFPDTLPFLQTASRHARLAVVSNFDARLVPILDGLGLRGYFEVVVTSGDAKASKPAPEIFHLALDGLGTRPADALHAGDCPRADAAGARAAGITPFLIQRPRQTLLEFLDFSGIAPS